MNLHDADVPRGPDAAPVPPGAGRFRRALALYFGSEVMLSVGIGLVNYAQPFFFQHGGMTDGLLMATENVVLSSLTPDDNKASVLSRFVAFYMCAIGAGMVAGGWLSAAHGYRTTMLVGAAVTLTSPCIRWFVRAPDALAQRAFRRPPVRLASMGLYSAGIGIAIGLFTPFATLVLKARFGLDDHVVSVISAVCQRGCSVPRISMCGGC